MRFRVPNEDLRRQISGSRAVIDEETGATVGICSFHWGDLDQRGRTICLFGKYGEHFKTHEECVAFAKGVEVVLNHMILPSDKRSSEQEPGEAA